MYPVSRVYCSVLIQLFALFSVFFIMVSTAHGELSPRIENVKFRSLSTKNGLAQDSVQDMTFDDRGFLYLASENGLDRWDGYHLQRIIGARNELQNVTINSLFYNNKNLYIGTIHKGIYLLNTESGQLSHIVDKPILDSDDLSQNVNAITLRNENEVLFVFEYEIGVYNTQDKRYTSIYTIDEATYRRGNAVRWTVPFKEHLLIAQSNGLFLMRANGDVEQVDYLPADRAEPNSQNTKHILIDSEGDVWVSTVRGSYLIRQQDILRHNEVNLPERVQEVVSGRNVWRVVEDVEKQFWLATDRGLFRATKYRDRTEEEFLFAPHNNQEAVSRDDILDIEMDAEGNLWLGTKSTGALYWSPISELFHTLSAVKSIDTSATPLTDDGVWSIAQCNEEDKVWIGTENGINRWDREKGTLDGWLRAGASFRYGDSYVNQVFVLPEDAVIYESGNGYWKFDPNTGKKVRLGTQSEEAQTVLNNFVYGSYLDDQYRIWFSSYEFFYRYDIYNKQLEVLPITGLNSHTFRGFLGAVPELNDRILVSALGKTLLLDPISLKVTELHAIPSESQALVTYPGSWEVDQKGILWLSYSGYGVVGLNTATGEQKYVLDESFLLDTSNVYGLQLDNADNLWISTANGLYQVDKSRTSAYHFVYGEALSFSEFNEFSDAKLRDGTLLFGSPSGLLHFNPERINQALAARHSKFARPDARLRITSVEVSTQADLPLYEDQQGATLALAHDDHGIEIRFSDMRSSQGSGHWFEYQLIANGEVVSEQNTQQPVVNIPVLEPGQYEFRATKRGASMASGNVAQLTINVDYAPWASPTAYSFYVALVLSLLASVIYARKIHYDKLNAEKMRSIMFGEAFQQTRDCVVLLSEDNQALAVNQAFQSSFALDDTRELSRSWVSLLRKMPALEQCILSQLSGFDDSQATDEHIQLEVASHQIHDFLVKSSLVDGARFGRGDILMVILSDISEQKSTERMLTQLATRDTLTGLANRQLLMDRLNHAIQHARHHQRKLAVLFIDLDRFKAVNDSLGHDIGDILLREISQRMQSFLPDDVTLARFGGDEFIAVIEDMEDINSISDTASALIQQIKEPVFVAEETLRVSCSIGAAIYPDDTKDPDVLLRFADMAMYSAKQASVAPFCFYASSMNEVANKRLHNENIVKTAYEEQRFYNVYQPIVNAETKRTVGFEMLLRCNLDDEFLSPAEFIPVLEQLRLVVDVTKVAFEQAASDLKTWYLQGFEGYVSVNLSALHFSEAIDIDFFLSVLKRFDLPIKSFRFEVTENILMQDQIMALTQFNALKQAGFVLAMDDFGTGYSSLGYLSKFPLDVIKIDKSFCDQIGMSVRGNGLIDTTIGIASSLSMGCIAEGIESAEQVAFLHQRGCNLLQGYYFSRPVSAELAAELAFKTWD